MLCIFLISISWSPFLELVQTLFPLEKYLPAPLTFAVSQRLSILQFLPFVFNVYDKASWIYQLNWCAPSWRSQAFKKMWKKYSITNYHTQQKGREKNKKDRKVFLVMFVLYSQTIHVAPSALVQERTYHKTLSAYEFELPFQSFKSNRNVENV